MSNYESITVEKRGPVAVLTINRPDKLNALNRSVHAEGVAALDDLRTDDSVRVLVITGAGPKSFIAGADISEFEGQTPVTQRDLFHERTFFNTIDAFPKPVIAMINGFCLGGGNELALACDIRICSENARFSQPEINLGIMPGGGGTQRLTRLIGEGRAMELILSGDMIDAETARFVAERGAYITPTLVTAVALMEAGRELGMLPESLHKVEFITKGMWEGLEHMRAAGVKLAFGTDLMGKQHVQQCREFTLRSRVFTPLEILRQATSIGAEALMMAGEIGCVAPGACADLILVDGDPLADIGLLAQDGARLSLIVRGGAVVKSAL